MNTIRSFWNELVEIPLRNAILILLVLLVGVHVYDSQPWPMVDVAEGAVRSVVVIECTDGTSYATTAGFVSSKYGHVITVAHGLAECLGKKEKNITVRFWDDPKIPYRAKIIKYDALADDALLQVPNAPRDIKPLAIAVEIQRQGARTLAIGHPQLFYWSVTFGIVSADRMLMEPPRHIIQVSSLINSGNSGGPIVNDKAEVIGIASFNIGGNPTLGFLVPGDVIAKLMNGTYH